jgi:hypothetical protein
MRTDEGARAVKRAHSMALLNRPGVCGVGVEHDERGEPILAIHIDRDDPGLMSQLPTEIDGYPVRLVVQPGGFRKLPISE